jgi:hypothetical protein
MTHCAYLTIIKESQDNFMYKYLPTHPDSVQNNLHSRQQL